MMFYEGGSDEGQSQLIVGPCRKLMAMAPDTHNTIPTILNQLLANLMSTFSILQTQKTYQLDHKSIKTQSLQKQKTCDQRVLLTQNTHFLTIFLTSLFMNTYLSHHLVYEYLSPYLASFCVQGVINVLSMHFYHMQMILRYRLVQSNLPRNRQHHLSPSLPKQDFS